MSSFTSLIDTYAQTNEWDGISQSERILNRLLDQYMEGNDCLEPNVASWTIVISAWARLARKRYNHAADRADRLLRRMEELYSEGRTTVAPDAVTLITVMNAWAASKSIDGAERAEQILDEMNEIFVDGDDTMKPTTKSIKVVVESWINSSTDPSAMDRAESLLDKYEELEEFEEPIVDEAMNDMYQSILFGYTKNKDPHHAEQYLRNMASMGMKPTSIFYHRIIDAYTQLNAPNYLERTYKVFELAEERRKEGDLKPTERLYTSFIRALTKALVPGLAKNAAVVLKKMIQLFEEGNNAIKPTIFTHNAVLNACAESVEAGEEERLQASKVAIENFNNLHSDDDGPDHVTFGNMLRCAALLPEGGVNRDAVISSTFQCCCKQGFVNSYVIRDLQYAASEELWRSLLSWPVGEVDCDQLPPQWKVQFDWKPQKFDKRKSRPTGKRFSKRSR